MIQRLQTVYFLIAIVLIGSLFFVPFAEIVNAKEEIYRFDSQGLYIANSQTPNILFGNIPFMILNLSCIILLLVTIFQYKNRSRQILFCRIIILILLTIVAINGFNLWRYINLFPGNYQLKICLVFPVIAIVLIFMAMKAIKNDEKLLKSANRIR
jgi:hypothetical protein